MGAIFMKFGRAPTTLKILAMRNCGLDHSGKRPCSGVWSLIPINPHPPLLLYQNCIRPPAELPNAQEFRIPRTPCQATSTGCCPAYNCKLLHLGKSRLGGVSGLKALSLQWFSTETSTVSKLHQLTSATYLCGSSPSRAPTQIARGSTNGVQRNVLDGVRLYRAVAGRITRPTQAPAQRHPGLARVYLS